MKYKGRTKMVFDTLKHRDGQIKALKGMDIVIDSKNPLVIWIK